MSVRVRIPTPLRTLTGGAAEVDVGGASLAECIDQLEAQYPGIEQRLKDENGELRRFVNLYVNGEDVRFLQGLDTRLKSGDEVSIVPAVAGGAENLTPPPRDACSIPRRALQGKGERRTICWSPPFPLREGGQGG